MSNSPKNSAHDGPLFGPGGRGVPDRYDPRAMRRQVEREQEARRREYERRREVRRREDARREAEQRAKREAREEAAAAAAAAERKRVAGRVESDLVLRGLDPLAARAAAAAALAALDAERARAVAVEGDRATAELTDYFRRRTVAFPEG